VKIGLGSAQFGLDYGISNRSGRVSSSELVRILAMARDAGVRVIDTAPAYGDAEERLGHSLGEAHPFRIVTKLSQCPSALNRPQVVGWARDSLYASLSRLRANDVYGLLVHAAGDLLGPSGGDIWEALEKAREAGYARRIGVSIYGARQLDALLERYPLDLVQLPMSVFDQRLVADGRLERLRQAGTEVHVRSVFLQGLLLMDPDDLGDPYFAGARDPLRAFHAAAYAAGRTPLEAAATFAVAHEAVDAAIFGVASAAQLGELLAAQGTPLPQDWYAPFALDDVAILDPTRWPT
jgi:aryl-alcohol dehydrogenase-like predicted oxidoreductase